MGWIASWILEFDSLAIPNLFLTQQLFEKSLENVVGHGARIGIRLAFTMEDGSWRRVDAVHLTESEIFVDKRIERPALDERANFGHFRGRKHPRDRAVHVAGLFPFFLILVNSLFHARQSAAACALHLHVFVIARGTEGGVAPRNKPPSVRSAPRVPEGLLGCLVNGIDPPAL